MSARSSERIKDQALANMHRQAPGLAAYIESRRQRGIPTTGRRWHRGT